jgi:hypothetical protein
MKWRTAWVIAAAGCATWLALGGCGPLYQLAGYPPEATRTTPPPKIEERVLDARAPAPAIEAPSTNGTWKLDDEKITVLVFFRGHW